MSSFINSFKIIISFFGGGAKGAVITFFVLMIIGVIINRITKGNKEVSKAGFAGGAVCCALWFGFFAAIGWSIVAALFAIVFLINVFATFCSEKSVSTSFMYESEFTAA